MLNRLLSLRCPECGEKIGENERYCPHCGTDLDAPIEQVVDKTKSKEYLEKAQTNYDKGANKVALHDCDLSIQYDPNSAEAHNLRGLILDAMGLTNEAMVSYQEALHLDPNFEDAKANLEDTQSEFRNSSMPKPDSQNNVVFKIILIGAGISAVLCALIVLGILYKFALPYIGPKTQIILEPDYSRVSTVDPADLETAAQILTARCRVLGCGTSFVVVENNQIVAQVPKSVDVEAFAKSAIAIGLLEFVDFGKTQPSYGTIIATDFDYKYLPQVEGIKWHTIMTNSEFESVSVIQDRLGKYTISFTLNSNGTKIFSNYTNDNVGHYLGIVLDKVVVSAPMVNAPITGGTGIISGNFTKEQAENLAVYLRIKGPLPIPLKVKGGD